MEDTMEEEKKDENLEEEETSPQEPESEEPQEEEEETEEEEKQDFEKELKELEQTEPPKRTEKEKAEFSLKKNADRLRELGGDPTSILKPEEKVEETDVKKVIKREFDEREARKLAKSDEEFKLIMWRVDHQGLSVEDSYILTHKNRLLKRDSELKRAGVTPSKGGTTTRTTKTEIPQIPENEQKVLRRRGLTFNAETNRWEGKYSYIEYNPQTKQWETHKK